MKMKNVGQSINWNNVDTVLLDMDGTLLDRHFDDYFFEEALPHRYADKYGLDFIEAQKQLMAMYRGVEGQLIWADLPYWTEKLCIDVVALTRELDYLIGFLPDAVDFLHFLRGMGKTIYITTNAHPTNVAIKIEKTGLNHYVDQIVHAFGSSYTIIFNEKNETLSSIFLKSNSRGASAFLAISINPTPAPLLSL